LATVSPLDLTLDIRMALSGVLLSSALLKLQSGTTNKLEVLEAIGFRVTSLVRSTTSLLVPLEIALSAWLLAGRFVVFGLLGTACLLGVFCVVLSHALRKNYQGSCGCFGNSRRHISRADLALNGLLLIASCSTAVAEWRYDTPRSLIDATSSDFIAAFMLLGLFSAVRHMIGVTQSAAR
jgi:Methylamine utilisation protein MauE